MLRITNICFGIILVSFYVNCLFGQSGCITAVGAIYGSPNSNERAKSILPTPGNDGLYAVGMKEDSVLIVRLNLMGQILWARTFDIVPGVIDNVSSAILDGEGMILTEGIAGDYIDGGNIFAFRYNPVSNQILWTKEYVNSSMRSYTFPVMQMANGDYLLGCNPHPPFPASTSDSELLRISKANGNPVPGMDKVFDLGGSDEFTEIILYQNFIYGCGRYTDGTANSKMRYTLMKIDPNTLDQVWVRCGYATQAQTARLYARDLIIDADIIYSVGFGDPTGTSSSNTQQYLQKTDLNGNLIWVNQYVLPGNNDLAYQIIKSGNGLVILAGKGAAPSDIILYKVDLDGAMLWGRQFLFSPPIVTSIQIDRGNSQIIEVGGNLFLTATGVTTNGTTDILIIRMDLDGNTDMPCVTAVPVDIPVIPVSSPAFYDVNPSTTNESQTANTENPDIVETAFTYRTECIVTDTIFAFEYAIICPGDLYEGYSIAGTYEDYYLTAEGCDSLHTLTLDIYPQETTTEQITLCLGESYNGYSVSGVYSDTFQNVFGCDSVHVLTLNINPIVTDLDIVICEGESFFGYSVSGFYTDTIQGFPNECDTIQNLSLSVMPVETILIDATICDGESYEGYTTSGFYTDIFTGIQGCDSIRELNLMVLNDDFTTDEVTICLGENYNGYSESGTYSTTFQNIFGCDSTHSLNLDVVPLENNLFISICEGEQYAGYTQSGSYVDTLQGLPGECDTVRYLNLEVRVTDLTSILISICAGDEYEGYTETGQYTDVFVNQYGCDSTRVLDLTVTSEITQGIDTTICTGGNYLGYNTTGVYIDTFNASGGCDSIRTLVLTVLDQLLTNASITICHGEDYEGYENEGVYVDTFNSVYGCDSIRTLDLHLSFLTQDVSVSLCSGGSFEGHSIGGLYIDTLYGQAGVCDTLRSLMISIAPPLLTYINAGVCSGQTFLGYNQTGMYSDTFQTIDGCDSVRILNLIVDTQIETSEIVSICTGQTYQGYSMAGMYIDTFTSAYGCDSIRQLLLDITDPVIQLTISICKGETYLGYSQTGVYEDTLKGTLNECDTLRFLSLTVLPIIESMSSQSICFGQSYEGYTTAGVYVDTFLTALGCDSLRKLALNVDSPQKQVIAEICAGQQYEQYSQSGIYLDTIPGTMGDCDTLRELNLTVLPVLRSQIDQIICDGDNYLGHSQAGIFVDTLTTILGCDSIRELRLQKLDPIMNTLTTSICDQELTNYTQPGVYFDTLVSYQGCDSLLRFVIEDAGLYIPNVFSPNGDGINDVFTVFPYPVTEFKIEYFGIFDRFGDMVYETKAWPIVWSGQDHNGQLFQPAVFAYVLIYRCTDQEVIQHGNITLIK